VIEIDGHRADDTARVGSNRKEEADVIVRNLGQIAGGERDVHGDGWRSQRLLLRDDEMGFSLSETTVEAGAELRLHSRHPLEACYCISGSAEIEELETGARHAIGPGTVYALDRHDRHVLRVTGELHLVCVFTPPLSGRETHDAEGGYLPAEQGA
jgi:L-ectoine synthase